MKTILILNGDILDYNVIKKHIDKEDFVIICDGGLRHCKNLDVIPNLIIGDFDSVDTELLKSYKDKSQIKKYPVDKDFTDGELGVIEAKKIGNSILIILGAMSINGRVDHMFSNVFMLESFVNTNILASIVTEKSEVFILNSGLYKRLKVKPNRKYCSLIPITEKVNVKFSKGLKYDLTNQSFDFGSSRSVSNECLDEEIIISLKNGKALIIFSED